jgi:hypothetical protein
MPTSTPRGFPSGQPSKAPEQGAGKQIDGQGKPGKSAQIVQKSRNTNVPAPSAAQLEPSGNEIGELVPAAIRDLFGPPPVLDNEDPAKYHQFFALLALDLKPRSVMEWMFVNDIANIYWEIIRLRRLKSSTVKLNLPSASFYVFGKRLDEIGSIPYYENVQEELIQLAVLVRRDSSNNPRDQKRLSLALRKVGLTNEDFHDAAAIDNLDIMDRIDAAIVKLERRRERTVQEFRSHQSIGASLSQRAFETVVDHFEKELAIDT